MPELPEVETVRRGLEPAFVDATIVRVEQRRPGSALPVSGGFRRAPDRPHRDPAGGRRAKYLLAHLNDGPILVMHLGMSGSFRIEADDGSNLPGLFHQARSTAATHDHVVFHLSNGARIVYNDPRRFGFMLLVHADAMAGHPLFVKIGLEPLGDDLTAEALARLFRGAHDDAEGGAPRPDAGSPASGTSTCARPCTGPVSRRDAPPRRSCARTGTPSARARLLVSVIRDVLSEAVAAGGSSLRDHRQTDGTLGYFQHTFRVYDRVDDPCPLRHCSGVVRRIVQNGRSTFYCPECQR